MDNLCFDWRFPLKWHNEHVVEKVLIACEKSVVDESSFLNATTSNPVTLFDDFYSILSESVNKNHFKGNTVAYHYSSMSVVLKTHHLGNYRNWIFSIECSRLCLICEMRYACSFKSRFNKRSFLYLSAESSCKNV